ALDALAARHPDMAIPGYTHMQQAMPSSVALWAQGFAAEIRDDAEGLTLTQEPVTAVQLSRGKAEAQLLFEITLLAQDTGRLAADLMLFYTAEFGFVTLPAAFTTASSIMPQK